MLEETTYFGLSATVWIAVVAVLLLVAAVVAVVWMNRSGKVSEISPVPSPEPSGLTQPAVVVPIGPSPAPVSGTVIPPVLPVVQHPAPAPAPGGLVEQAQGMGAGIIAVIVVVALVGVILLFMGGKKGYKTFKVTKVASKAEKDFLGENKLENLTDDQKVQLKAAKVKAIREMGFDDKEKNKIKSFYPKDNPPSDNELKAVFLLNRWGLYKTLKYLDVSEPARFMNQIEEKLQTNKSKSYSVAIQQLKKLKDTAPASNVVKEINDAITKSERIRNE